LLIDSTASPLREHRNVQVQIITKSWKQRQSPANGSSKAFSKLRAFNCVIQCIWAICWRLLWQTKLL